MPWRFILLRIALPSFLSWVWSVATLGSPAFLGWSCDSLFLGGPALPGSWVVLLCFWVALRLLVFFYGPWESWEEIGMVLGVQGLSWGRLKEVLGWSWGGSGPTPIGMEWGIAFNTYR